MTSLRDQSSNVHVSSTMADISIVAMVIDLRRDFTYNSVHAVLSSYYLIFIQWESVIFANLFHSQIIDSLYCRALRHILPASGFKSSGICLELF